MSLSEWRIVKTPKAKEWGVRYCPEESREGCRKVIYTTPRSAQNHAKRLRDYFTQEPTCGILQRKGRPMTLWRFTLIIEGRDVLEGQTADLLFEAGCDDASFGWSCAEFKKRDLTEKPRVWKRRFARLSQLSSLSKDLM